MFPSPDRASHFINVRSFAPRLSPLPRIWGCGPQPPLCLWPNSPTQMSIDQFLLAFKAGCHSASPSLSYLPDLFLDFSLRGYLFLVFSPQPARANQVGFTRVETTPAREMGLGVFKRYLCGYFE